MIESTVSLRAATHEDDAQLRSFLEAACLPADDVDTGRQEFLLMEEGGRLIGTVGLEIVGRDGLFRSLTVAPDRRGCGLAARLTTAARELARARGVTSLYLLTTTAAGYLSRQGFERVPRTEVPTGIAGLAQFKALCPSTAVCMRQPIA